MTMRLIRESDPTALDLAIESLAAGEPIVIPTDTVYGLAVRADDERGIDQIFALKARPENRTIATLVADVDQAGHIANLGVDDAMLAGRFWPGALTLVVPGRAGAAIPTAPDGTVGLRAPDRVFVRHLAAAVGPLATTSANRSNQPTPTHAVAAAESLTGRVSLVVDGGPCAGEPSTVIRCTDGGVHVLRVGRLDPQLMASATGLPLV